MTWSGAASRRARNFPAFTLAGPVRRRTIDESNPNELGARCLHPDSPVRNLTPPMGGCVVPTAMNRVAVVAMLATIAGMGCIEPTTPLQAGLPPDGGVSSDSGSAEACTILTIAANPAWAGGQERNCEQGQVCVLVEAQCAP